MKAREPFITTVFYIGGPRDGGSAVVSLHEPPPLSCWYDEDGNYVEIYCGFEPRMLCGRFGSYQIAKDGNYHWHPCEATI